MKNLVTINTLIIALVALVIMLVATHIAQYMAYKEGLESNAGLIGRLKELTIPGTGTEGQYKGCYNDDGVRAMTNTSRNLYRSREECRQLAISQGYKYYATQNKIEQVGKKIGWCTGSNDFAAATRYGEAVGTNMVHPNGKCNYEDDTGYMGGAMSNAIYAVYDKPPEYKNNEDKVAADKENARLGKLVMDNAWADRDAHLDEETIRWEAVAEALKVEESSKAATRSADLAQEKIKEARELVNKIRNVLEKTKIEIDKARASTVNAGSDKLLRNSLRCISKS